jgi:2-polyprenyl-3-methyl-5-hydroxy-6-metoxy-1,4-benzoquinol methylase
MPDTWFPFEEQCMSESRQEIFNRVYRGKEMYYGWQLCEEFTDALERADTGGKMALDLGCGEGRYAVYLAERGYHVTAIDISEVGLDKLAHIAEQRGLDITCVLRDLGDYAFSESSYDVVVAATVLGHLGDETRQGVVAGIKGALKSGGIVYVNVFTVDDPGYRMQRGDHSGEGGMTYGVSETSISDLRILYYAEGKQKDLSHGTPHYHGLARMIARRV